MISNMGKSRKHGEKHMKTLSVTLTAYKTGFKSVVILIAFYLFFNLRLCSFHLFQAPPAKKMYFNLRRLVLLSIYSNIQVCVVFSMDELEG